MSTDRLAVSDADLSTVRPRNHEAAAPVKGRRMVMAVFAGIAAWAFLRDLPAALWGLDELLYWHVVPVVNPLEYIAFPQSNAIQVFARLTFLVAHPFGDLGPVVLRLLSSLVIGGVAAFVVSDRMAEAIRSKWVRVGLALSIVLLPIRAPFIQTLNSQWWIALVVLGIALTKPRRWDAWFLGFAGLCGLAPCAVLPAFRDRRAIPLLAGAVVQVLVYATTGRPQTLAPHLSGEWLALAAGLGLLFITSLPVRTRIGFAYLGLVLLLLGSTREITSGADRYELAAWMGISLAVVSIARAVLRWLAVADDRDDAISARTASLRAGLTPAATAATAGPATDTTWASRGGSARRA